MAKTYGPKQRQKIRTSAEHSWLWSLDTVKDIDGDDELDIEKIQARARATISHMQAILAIKPSKTIKETE